MIYSYTTAIVIRHQRRLVFVFRKSDEGIEVKISKDIDSPCEIGLKVFQKALKNLSKGMKEAKLTTHVHTMDEYFHEDLGSVLRITGWVPLKSDDHKALLASAPPFKS